MDVERKRKFENRGDEIVEELPEQFGRPRGSRDPSFLEVTWVV
jgi:hypothetical protein